MATKTVISGTKVQCIEENVVGEMSVEAFLSKMADLPFGLDCGYSDGFIKRIAHKEGLFEAALWYPWSLKSLPVVLYNNRESTAVHQVPMFIPAHLFMFAIVDSDAGFRLRQIAFKLTDNLGRNFLSLSFPNVGNGSIICMGNAAVPAQKKLDDLMNKLVDLFWTTPMNADLISGGWGLASVAYKRELNRIIGPTDGTTNELEKRLRESVQRQSRYSVHASSYILGQMIMKDEKYFSLVNSHTVERVNEALPNILAHIRRA